MQFLALIFDPLGDAEASVEAIEMEGVTRDSEIPAGLPVGPILEIDPLPELEIDPLPEPLPLAGLGENCLGFDENTGEAFPDCQPDFVCEEDRELVTIPGANFFCQYATGLIIPPEEEPPLLGGWSETISADDPNFDADTLLSEGVIDQLRDETGIDFDLFRLDGYRQQVVAGLNYVALYTVLDNESGDSVSFLAEISVPLGDAEAAVEAIMTEGVTEDSDIPAGLPVGPILDIDPLPELEIDPLPELEPLPRLLPLAGLGENCEGFDESTGEAFPRCQPDFVCEEDTDLITIPGANFFC